MKVAYLDRKDRHCMNIYSWFQEQLNKPPPFLEQEQFEKVMLDCVEPGVGYTVFFLIGCAAVFGYVPSVYLGVCGCMVVSEAVIKINLVKKFEKQNSVERANPTWRRIIWSGAFYSGVFFGLLSLVLLLPLPQENLLLLAFAYLGIYVCSCWLGSAYWPVLVCKLIPLTLPLIIAFVWLATPMSLLIAIALLFVTGISLFYVRSIVRQHSQLVSARQHVEEISENLKMEKLAAEQLVVSKNRFIASASHDLRQPLHALGLFHSAIRASLKDDKIHALMDSVDKSTAALNNLFEGLLDVSRLDSGAVEAVYEHFEFDLFAISIGDEFSQLAQSKGLQLDIKCEPCVVFSDRLLIEQVLRNLLSNAIKFTEVGSIVLSAQYNKTGVSVSVSDTGSGIPENEIEHVFDEFYQAERSEHHVERGFGLGLAIVRRISQLLDMSLSVNTNEDQGVCITFELPPGDQKQVRHRPMPIPVSASPLNISVMVIDDNIGIVDGMKSLLIDWGVTCLAANSSEAAIQILQETSFIPDLLICDYHLSAEVKGPAVARAISEYLGQSIPLVVITGDTTITSDKSGGVEGHDVLYKPVRANDLREAILAKLKRTGAVKIN